MMNFITVNILRSLRFAPLTAMGLVLLLASGSLAQTKTPAETQAPAEAKASSKWTMTSALVRSKDGKVKKHQLEFALGSVKLRYAPQEPPLGLVSSEEVQIEGQSYFVTGWAHGPSSVLYRVFAPGLKKTMPLCEAPSLSESAELKRNEGKIQLATYLNAQDNKVTWVNCQ